MRELLIRLLIGKKLVIANLGGIPPELFTGLNSICQLVLQKEVLFINTYVKPHAEPAKPRKGG